MKNKHRRDTPYPTLNGLLGIILDETATSTERRRAAVDLARRLERPDDLLSCRRLPPEHPLRTQALAVADAFEAVTDGMENADALAAVERLPAASPLAPWPPLIRALAAFHRNDRESLAREAAAIPEGTPPARLKAALLAAAAGRTVPALTGAFEEASERDDLLEQAEEAARSGLTDLFVDVVARCLPAVRRSRPDRAESLALWCLEAMLEQEPVPGRLVRVLRTELGDRDAYRLAALASGGYDNDRSLVYWLDAFRARAEEGPMETAERRARETILAETRRAVEEDGLMTGELRSLLRDRRDELDRLLPEYPGAGADDGTTSDTAGSGMTGRDRRRPGAPGSCQLELFSL